MTDVGSQKQAFLTGEGDAYFERNRKLPSQSEDPILDVMKRLKIEGTSVLEIGCGSCRRLGVIEKTMGAECSGIDPSGSAIEAGKKAHPRLHLEIGTADRLPFASDGFDLVILGFFLYLSDPADHFLIAHEADRVLKQRGILLVHDFCSKIPYSNAYGHRDEILSRKMEWSRMFTWHPAYSLIHRELAIPAESALHDVDARTTVDVLIKNLDNAFPIVSTARR